MTINDYREAIRDIAEKDEAYMIYNTPGFRCDQAYGHPVCLCVSWKESMAWLVPNETLVYEEPEITEAWQGCAEFGIKVCHDIYDFICILDLLGEDPYDTARTSADDSDEESEM